MTAVLDRAARDAPLKVREDPVVGVAQAFLITGKRDHADAEQRQDHEVKRPVDRDQAQHHLVAQRLAAQRHLNLIAFRQLRALGLLGRRQRQPAVAAQAPVPADGAGLTGEQRVLRAKLRSVGSDEHMAAESARDQLPVDLAPGSRLWMRAGRMMHSAQSMLIARANTSPIVTSAASA